jgi:hypothetical protein
MGVPLIATVVRKPTGVGFLGARSLGGALGPYSGACSWRAASATEPDNDG